VRRVIIGFVLVILLVGILFVFEIYLWNSRRKPGTPPEGKVVETRGEVFIQRDGGKLTAKVGEGRVLILSGKGLFLLRENSRAEFTRKGVLLSSGSLEFSGEGFLENRKFSCSFKGEGLLLEGRIFVTGGMACGIGEGKGYDGEKTWKINIPSLEVKVTPSGLLVSTASPMGLEISQDPFFVSRELKLKLSSPKILKLGNGLHYLRACLEPVGLCSSPQVAAVKNLQAQLKRIDKTPPKLEVSITPKGRVVIIRGVTEVGVKVFINGKRVPVETSGRFFHTLEFDSPGPKLVVVEAVDSAGNISRKSKEVVVYGD